MAVALLATRALWTDTVWLIAQGQSHWLTLAAARQTRQGIRLRVIGHGGLVADQKVAKNGVEVLLKELAIVVC
eukprot:4035308-Pleurochrysis_carterae.AAC.2